MTRGWYRDSYRHYLAAKGIATKKYFARTPRAPRGFQYQLIPRDAGRGIPGKADTRFGRLIQGIGEDLQKDKETEMKLAAASSPRFESAERVTHAAIQTPLNKAEEYEYNVRAEESAHPDEYVNLDAKNVWRIWVPSYAEAHLQDLEQDALLARDPIERENALHAAELVKENLKIAIQSGRPLHAGLAGEEVILYAPVSERNRLNPEVLKGGIVSSGARNALLAKRRELARELLNQERARQETEVAAAFGRTDKALESVRRRGR